LEIQDLLERIENREDFIKFISYLIQDLKQNANEWANTNIEDYLRGIAAWVEDVDGLFTDPEDLAESVDWHFVATILYTGSRYE
jgi:hypothetical protein